MLRSIALGLALFCAAIPVRADDATQGQPLTPYQTALSKYKYGNYADASAAIDEADKANPNDPPTIILKARILIELHDFAGAKAALESLNKIPNLPPEVDKAATLAFGDLSLRKGSYDEATKFYESLLEQDPNNPDTILKVVYSRAAAGDLIEAAKYASKLNALDQVHPDYYFAKAAITEATTGADQQTGEDIETARTIYGMTTTNRYLKTYLQIFAHKPTTASAMTPPPRNTPVPTGVK